MVFSTLSTQRAALLATAFVFALYPQQSGSKDPLTFEVASVKASTADCPPCGYIHQLPGQQTYEVKAAPLRLIMTVAYQVTDRQISGGPSWMNSDRFNITAKAAHPRTSDELHTMLAHLLEERFQLKVRREARPEPVWNLVVDKGGPKMPVHDPEDKVHEPIGGMMVRGSDGGFCMTNEGQNATMNYFAFFLSRGLDRGVIDKTGLPGAYDVKLQYVPEGLHLPEGVEAAAECSDLFRALPKQLGLRLEPSRGPVEYLVVERAEKPGEN
jgi:uncharacterized protein (TIGR03435 family)